MCPSWSRAQCAAVRSESWARGRCDCFKQLEYDTIFILGREEGASVALTTTSNRLESHKLYPLTQNVDPRWENFLYKNYRQNQSVLVAWRLTLTFDLDVWLKVNIYLSLYLNNIIAVCAGSVTDSGMWALYHRVKSCRGVSNYNRNYEGLHISKNAYSNTGHWTGKCKFSNHMYTPRGHILCWCER